MGYLSGPMDSFFRIIIFIAIAIILAVGAVSYYSGKEEGTKQSYEQGVKDAMSGKVDSIFLKK